MLTLRILAFSLLLFTITSFSYTSSCTFAGSNINFAKKQTEAALTKSELSQVHYYSYKALNAIENTTKELTSCNCKYATKTMSESTVLLKKAISNGDLFKTKMLLKNVLNNIVISLEELEKHDLLQHSTIEYDVVTEQTKENKEANVQESLDDDLELKQGIEDSLEKYKTTLSEVVRTVDCEKAKIFAERIYKECEQKLLFEELTEAKKYYTLRTKEITEIALAEIIEKCES